MFLKEICNISAPSSYEDNLGNFIKEKVEKYVDEIKIDKMGNIIVRKYGEGKKVVVNVHMDEPGFIITGYNNDGTLKFTSLGETISCSIPCKCVTIGNNKVCGVIGLKPIHLQDKSYREKNIKMEDLYIDIGASSKDEAKKNISIGEYATFYDELISFGQNLIKARGLDSKIGCDILMEILKEDYDCDFYGVFTVQNKVGFRGSLISAYNIEPDICLSIQGISYKSIGEGPILSILSGNNLEDLNIYKEIKKLADNEKIPYQVQKCIFEENDGISYKINGRCIKTSSISISCRYINSPSVVCSIKDFKNTIKLVKIYLKNIKNN